MVIHQKVMFNSILRSMLTSYLAMCVSTYLSVKNMAFHKVSDIISSALSIGTLTFMISFPVFTYIFMKRYAHRLEETSFKPRFSSLYLNVRTEDPYCKKAITLFLARRFIFATSISFFEKVPSVQIGLQQLMSVGLIAYYLAVRPYSDKLLNRLEIFNELCLLTGSYVLIGFTDLITDPVKRYNAGWLMTSLVILCATVNMALIIWKLLSTIYFAIKRRLLRRKMQKYKITINNSNSNDTIMKLEEANNPNTKPTMFNITNQH